MLQFLFTSTPLRFFAQSFWRDEAFSFLLAKKNVVEILFLTAKDFNPPLYYLFLHFWMKLFGSSEISLRTPSLIFYCITVYIGYMIMRDVIQIKGRRIFLYVFLIAINPVLLYYAFEARMYTMFACFATWSFYAFFTKKKFLYLLTTVIGLYTQYFMLLVIATQVVIILLSRKKQYSQFIISICLLIPWALFVFWSKPPISSSFWIDPLKLEDILLSPILIYTGFERNFGFLQNIAYTLIPVLGYTALTIYTLIAFSIFKIKKTRNQRMIYLNFSLWFLVPLIIIIIVSLVKPVFLPRYLIFVSVGITLFLILILEQFKKIGKTLFYLTLVILCLSYQKIQIHYRTKTDFARSIREIQSLAHKNDSIYVVSELDFHTTQYYMRNDNINRVFIYGKSYDIIPWYVGKVLITKENIATSLPTFPRKAFVVKSDGSYDILSSL